MRFGLIGYGAWGRFHARAIAGHPEAALVAIACSSEATAAAALRDYPQARVTTDYRTLLADPEVETVDIVLPIHLHAEVGAAALAAGKDVLLEKPMARTLEECDRLIAARERSGRLLTISHDWRVSNHFVLTKELLDAGELGELAYMSINLFRNQFRGGAGDWRITPDKVGSWILEEPVHFFDLVLWYMASRGDPVSVFATGNGVGQACGLYDNFTAILRFPGDAYATVTQTLSGFEHHTQVQLAGSAGAVRTWWSAKMDRAEQATLGYQVRKRDTPFERGVYESDSVPLEPENHQVKVDKQIARVLGAFRAAIAPTPGEEARKRVAVCLAADRAIREGRELPLAL